MASLIELNSVSKIYSSSSGHYRALKKVDITISQGEFVSILGPSGSGKSTCLNIMGCLDVPTEGEYILQGQNIGSLSEHGRALVRRNMMGFIFQGFNLLARKTAVENVELPLLYRGVPASVRREAALSALDRVGMKRWSAHFVSDLSGGQQQRVAIARATVSMPKILFADEPTGNLDSKNGEAVFELLEFFNSVHGVTVLLVTHEKNYALPSSRVIEFRDGSVLDKE